MAARLCGIRVFLPHLARQFSDGALEEQTARQTLIVLEYESDGDDPAAPDHAECNSCDEDDEGEEYKP